MPEGDTILRTAQTLQRAIGGREVRAARTQVPGLDAASLVGHTVARVEAQGKNLIVRFDDGRFLRTHMRMNGSWHVYRPGERWWKAPHHARLVLETEAFVAVCFSAPAVELLRAKDEAVHPALSSLGPDILAEDFDAPAAIARLRSLAAREIGDAILDQRAVAGIGNIYKSESLHLAGVDPFAKVATLDDAVLATILKRARALMRAAVRGTRGRLAVYRRSGRACYRCGTTIRMRRQGELARSTYYCATCQGVAGAAAASGGSAAGGAGSTPDGGGA